MKKDSKAWAIKLRGRSFYQNVDGVPFLFATKRGALSVALRIKAAEDMLTAPTRVKVRIEEIK